MNNSGTRSSTHSEPAARDTGSSAPPKGERIEGAICWNELHTRDVDRARAFYTKVVGWKAHSCPTVPGGHAYTEWVRPDGAHVGGMMAAQAGEAADEAANWAAYVNVSDVDAIIARAASLGGRVVTPPFDVPQVGRLAAIADPSGAVLHIIKGVGNCGERVPQETPGSFCWMELLSSNPAACVRFYGALFGWKTTVMSMPDFEYTLLWLAGADPEKKQGSVGGLMKIPAEWGSMTSSWLSYIMVESVDAATERATAAGGTVACGPMDIPGVGRFSVVMDPGGATFALFTGSGS